MSKELQLSQEEIDSVKNIRDDFNKLTFSMGNVELEIVKQKMILNELDKAKNQLLNDRASILQREQDITKNLVDKYGAGTLDLEKKVYIKD